MCFGMARGPMVHHCRGPCCAWLNVLCAGPCLDWFRCDSWPSLHVSVNYGPLYVNYCFLFFILPISRCFVYSLTILNAFVKWDWFILYSTYTFLFSLSFSIIFSRRLPTCHAHFVLIKWFLHVMILVQYGQKQCWLNKA